MTTQYLFYILFGYLSGSVLYGYLLPKYIKKIDVTKESSGSESGSGKCISLRWSTDRILCIDPGTSEGISAGACGNACVKSATPYFWFGVGCTGSRACVSVLESEDGGKSIAVSFGVLLGLVPYWRPVLILAVCYLMFSIVIVIRPHFFRSVVTFAIFWGMVIIKRGPLGITAGTGILSFVVIWKHLVKYQNERLEITFPGRQEKV